jgi:hypothetical protein
MQDFPSLEASIKRVKQAERGVDAKWSGSLLIGTPEQTNLRTGNRDDQYHKDSRLIASVVIEID